MSNTDARTSSTSATRVPAEERAEADEDDCQAEEDRDGVAKVTLEPAAVRERDNVVHGVAATSVQFVGGRVVSPKRTRGVNDEVHYCCTGQLSRPESITAPKHTLVTNLAICSTML